MDRIKAATRIKQELMDQDQRRQLRKDYQAVVDDCNRWEKEEHDKRFYGHGCWWRRAIYLFRREICRISWFAHNLSEEIKSWFW